MRDRPPREITMRYASSTMVALLAVLLACSSEHDQAGTEDGALGGDGAGGSGRGGTGSTVAAGAGVGGLAGGGGAAAAVGGVAATAGVANPPASGASGAAVVGGGAGSGSGGAAVGGGGAVGCDVSLAASNKARANAALEALFVEKQLSAIGEYWADPYLQHNPIAKSGVAAFQSVMSGVVSSPSFSYQRLRSFAECELVVVQGRYSGTGVIFDLFRLQGGKLVEHWDSDANQASDAAGPTEPTDWDQTDNNRGIVLDYLAHGSSELRASDYVDHRAGSAATLTYATTHHVIAEGSFVFALSEGALDGAPTALYDLFRLQSGKLVEHWDSRRAVPATTASGLGIF